MSWNSTRCNAVRRFIGLWITPAFPYVLFLNTRRVKDNPDDLDWDGHRSKWETDLNAPSAEQRDSVKLVYQQSRERLIGFESKAIGVLTAVAIIAAIAGVACTGAAPADWLGLIALLYLVSAGASCCWVLLPGRRFTLVLDEVNSATSGLAEMAASTRMAEPPSIRASNLVTGALHDLVKAMIISVAALAAFVIVHQDGSPIVSNQNQPGAATTTTTVRPGPTTTVTADGHAQP